MSKQTNKAPPGASAKDTTPPCKICGWGPHMAIHRNPKLAGRQGSAFHSFVAKEDQQ